MRLREHPLQLLQLRAGERGPDAPLLPLLVQSSVVREQLVRNWGQKKRNVTVRRAKCSRGLIRKRSVRVCVCVLSNGSKFKFDICV